MRGCSSHSSQMSLIFSSAGEDLCSLLMLTEGWNSGVKALAFHTGHVVLSHLTWQSSQKRNRGESQLLPPPLPVELLRWDEALFDSMLKTVACAQLSCQRGLILFIVLYYNVASCASRVRGRLSFTLAGLRATYWLPLTSTERRPNRHLP